MIEEKSISIENNQGVLLHGGQSGWNTKEWEVIHDKKPNSIRFKYRCNEGNSGFPGNIEAEINYTLKDNRICLDYFATTDAPTHINLTNHTKNSQMQNMLFSFLVPLKLESKLVQMNL